MLMPFFRIPSPKEGKPIPVGFSIIKNLKSKVQEFGDMHPGKLQIMTDTPVVGIVTWNDFVTGVRIKNSTGHLGKFFLFFLNIFI